MEAFISHAVSLTIPFIPDPSPNKIFFSLPDAFIWHEAVSKLRLLASKRCPSVIKRNYFITEDQENHVINIIFVKRLC